MSDRRPIGDLAATLGLSTLPENAPPDSILATVERVRTWRRNGADPVDVAMLGEIARRQWKQAGASRPTELWDATTPPREDRDDDRLQGRALVLSDPEPWPEPVDGAELLGELVRTYARYLAQPDGAATADALWTLHAHAHDVAVVSPLLAFSSAAKRCGKTTALTVLGALVPRPLPASNITAAALFRAVEAYRPTLLVDEADTFLRDREELRGILNSGHTRAGAQVIRTVGDDHETRTFTTWSPKAIALIGDLPDTLRDRAIEVRLRRRRPDEAVERVRLDRLGELEPLRRRCARWAADNLDALREADPDVPGELHDRASDNWRPLLAIADVAGGEWPERARRAALRLSGAEVDDGDAGVLLLSDLRDLFAARGADRLASAEIVGALTEMEDRPWPEWRRGQPLTTRQLARLLQPFGVAPKQMRTDGGSGPKVRGYESADLEDPFRRYLPPDPVQAVHPSNGAENRASAKRYKEAACTGSEKAENPRQATIVPDVPDRNPEPRHVCRTCGRSLGGSDPAGGPCRPCRTGGAA